MKTREVILTNEPLQAAKSNYFSRISKWHTALRRLRPTINHSQKTMQNLLINDVFHVLQLGLQRVTLNFKNLKT